MLDSKQRCRFKILGAKEFPIFSKLVLLFGKGDFEAEDNRWRSLFDSFEVERFGM